MACNQNELMKCWLTMVAASLGEGEGEGEGCHSTEKQQVKEEGGSGSE